MFQQNLLNHWSIGDHGNGQSSFQGQFSETECRPATTTRTAVGAVTTEPTEQDFLLPIPTTSTMQQQPPPPQKRCENESYIDRSRKKHKTVLSFPLHRQPRPPLFNCNVAN